MLSIRHFRRFHITAQSDFEAWPTMKKFFDPESVAFLDQKIDESSETQMERFAFTPR